MESTNNISFIPLQSGRAFIGTYDTVSAYASAVLSLFADTACEIYMYQSQNKTGTYVSTYTTVGGTQFVQEVSLSAPYVYFVVRNTSAFNQTKMSFTVIYKTAYAGAGVSADVNILSQSAGLALNATIVATNALLQTKGVHTFWDNEAVGAGDTTSGLTLATLPQKTLSIFGATSAPTTITLMMSVDGVNYFLSQYSVLADGNFGYCIPCPFYSVCLYSSASATITAHGVYS